MASTYDGDGNRAFQLNYNPEATCGYGMNVSGEIFMPEHSQNEDESLTAEGQLFSYICSKTGRAYDLTEYVNDINRQYVETLTAYTINSGATKSYSYAGNQRLSRNNIWDEAQGVHCNQTSYYLYDGRGSVTANTWYNGMVTDVYQYDPYGQVELGSTKYTDFYGYNAESYNPNSGLEYLRARYYNANQGKFFREDTYLGNIIDPLTLNRYAYVKNSPINYVDPSGLKYVDGYGDIPLYGPSSATRADAPKTAIIYNTDFSKEANAMRHEIESNGGIIDDMRLADTESAFEEAWNSIDDTEIDELYLFMHGHERSIIMREQHGNISSQGYSLDGYALDGTTQIGDINSLVSKQYDDVYIYACNTGNYLAYMYESKNAASVLSQKTPDAKVHAWDGSVAFGYTMKFIDLRELSGYQARLSRSQGRYEKIMEAYMQLHPDDFSGRTKPLGELTYINGKLITAVDLANWKGC